MKGGFPEKKSKPNPGLDGPKQEETKPPETSEKDAQQKTKPSKG